MLTMFCNESVLLCDQSPGDEVAVLRFGIFLRNWDDYNANFLEKLKKNVCMRW